MVTKSTVRWYLVQGFKNFNYYKAVEKLMSRFGDKGRSPVELVVEKMLSLTTLEDGGCAVVDQCSIGDFIYALELTYSSALGCLKRNESDLFDCCEMLCLGLYDGENQSTDAYGYQSYLDAKHKFIKNDA